MKKIIITILLFNLIIAQSSIKIYNQGWALVQDEQKINFEKKGKQLLLISDLPLGIDPSSINLRSEGIDFLSKEYIYRPITIENLLDENIGNDIELVKYDQFKIATSSIYGKLLSNIDKPIFEIDNKIVIDPPYDYRFQNIPTNLKDYPYMRCEVNGLTKKNKYTLNYLIEGIFWGAEFNLYINKNNKSEIEGWYFIKNNNNFSYKMIEAELVSGNINFPKKTHPRSTLQSPHSTFASQKITLEKEPIIYKSNDYFIYKIPEKIDLSQKSEFRYKFLDKKEILYNNIYHISHQLSKYQRYNTSQTENVPVNIRLELDAKNLGAFQIPGGKYNVYEKNSSNITYIGSDISEIVSKKNKIKLEIGKSHEIICNFTIKEVEGDKNKDEIKLEAKFDNSKDKLITVNWMQNFPNGNWKIINSDHDYSTLNSHQIEFLVNIAPNSQKTVDFSVIIWKNRN